MAYADMSRLSSTEGLSTSVSLIVMQNCEDDPDSPGPRSPARDALRQSTKGAGTVVKLMMAMKAAVLLMLLCMCEPVTISSPFARHDDSVAAIVREATVAELQEHLRAGRLTSVALVEFYVAEIERLNPLLRAVIEVNSDAMQQAWRADRERRQWRQCWHLKKGAKGGLLHGIPILLKDNIATADDLNTTAGSFALLGSKVPHDSGVVSRLRRVGAIILGKANLSEWMNFRSSNSSNGWSARGGQTKNPYVLSDDPSGSSSGSAVAVAANMVAVSLGSETDGSILLPSSKNAVVGIKPTVGLTSRAGVVPISHLQDTIGPICRTVSDAAEVLEVIVGFDEMDNATWDAASLIPEDGYKQFLKPHGLQGKRIGVVNDLLAQSSSSELEAIGRHLHTMRRMGAEVIENVTISTLDEIDNFVSHGVVPSYEFKQYLNSYLADLVESPVRDFADVIQFNIDNSRLEELEVYDQALLVYSEATTGFGSKEYRDALEKQKLLTKNGIDKAMKEHHLDAIVGSLSGLTTSVAAIAGYPGITVPAGYEEDGAPFGLAFVAQRGSEPTLIEIAFSFEQATQIRKPPSFRP